VTRRAGAVHSGGVATTPADGPTRNDRVAIVTGGSGGLGREVMRTLAGRGYSVIVYFARNQCAADAAVEEILATNGTALTVRGHVGDELDVERLFAEASKAFGGVDVVVHTVGRIAVDPAAIDGLATLAAQSPTSVRGTFVVNRQAARELRDGGAIVNLFGPVVGLASPARAAYAASEGAAKAITRVVAGELRGRDITVNAVVLEQERPSIVTDVVDLVAFLASEAGHGVNGHVIRLNVGLE
jgi:3-oxoacyl-[acyl-carrier protein] reductase